MSTDKSYENYQKLGLSFNLDSFGRPLEYSGKEAWARYILELMFYEPGTFPSDERIGCGLTNQTFQNSDYIQNTVVPDIQECVQRYIPDIPFESIDVDLPEEYPDVAIYHINFRTGTNEIECVTVIAKEIDDYIDYSVL